MDLGAPDPVATVAVVRHRARDLYVRMLVPGRVVTYPITEIFRSLQGEGHFVGYPMVFVRLAGCSVTDCHIRAECDEAPWKMTAKMEGTEIVAEVRRLQRTGIVCITGGEPTDHDLTPVVCALHDAGFRVHLETSGVRPILGMPLEWLTVSPKVLSSDGLKQHTGHTLKIVMRPEWSIAEGWEIVRRIDAAGDFFHRYLQPMTGADGKPVNLDAVIKMLLGDENANGRWALSTQTHRLWNVP